MHNIHKGKILISSPDSNVDLFSKSVVLIVDHNLEGAFGLILNKKGEHIESNFKELLGTDLDIYIGGPVSPEQLFFIVKSKPFNEKHLEIDSTYFITEDFLSIVEAIKDNQLSTDSIKVFMGYSGWASQQLENEINNGCWTIVEDFPFDIINDSTHFWKKSKENLGGEHLLWANTPEDISMN